MSFLSMFLIALLLFLFNSLLYLKGMHGTVEWLPGSPLGSTVDSWPGEREREEGRESKRERERVCESERERAMER